jgi:hypothetical protein
VYIVNYSFSYVDRILGSGVRQSAKIQMGINENANVPMLILNSKWQCRLIVLKNI